MRLEFVVVIGIVLLMQSIYLAGVIASEERPKGYVAQFKNLNNMAYLYPVHTVIGSIPTFIVVGLLYWWLY